MILIIKLVLAHLLGDFVVQPASWVKAREVRKLRAWQLYAHAFVHGILAYILVCERSFALWALLLAFAHLIVDAAKARLQNNNNRRAAFFIDQFAHFSVLYMIACWYNGWTFYSSGILTGPHLLLLTALIFLTTPSSYITAAFIARWTPQPDAQGETALRNAGMYIGMLERLLTFTFILAGHWEGVGFLVAAKSIFRFGDLKEGADRKLTEYILIGTLWSFGLAVVTAIAYLWLTAR